MSNLKLFLLNIVMLIGFFLNAQSADVLFLNANGFYKNENYEQAIKQYQAIEKQGLVSADLYFNMGNCYYKQNSVAYAVYYYEKALKLDPNHSDASQNLIFAKRMTIDAIEEIPKTFLQRFSTNIIQKFDYNTWALGAILGSVLTTLLFLVYYFSERSSIKLLFFNASIFAMFLMSVSLIFAYINFETVQKNSGAVIFSPKVEVTNAPASNGEVSFVLHEGTKVIILDQTENWRKIKIADGKEGWIRITEIKEI
ncbi:tetratricopeptide repeat protein [Lutibacter sp.]|uniref:tetratricopeptide repeat protein n=1 Tax=Lutibacter sp. TaxID=1925666 RepID=UPI002733CFC2|nr:tetratricopeptide repeat protein [Lutibacter sp.]MDP3314128.1 tetratricopeptide repeat protein [Lutibacter sp.]